MAASAYAAVLSLMHILDNLRRYPACQRLHFERDQIKALHDKVSFLLNFLEDYSQRFCADLEDLARQIAVVANEAEDVVDCHVVDQPRQRSADKADMGLSSFSEDIGKLIEKIESIKKELLIFKEETTIQEKQPSVSRPSETSTPLSSGKNTMVGFEDHLARIMDQLTGDNSDLQIIPIVGMGGIGKTTLAKNVFNSQYIVDHFDIRIWFTISQEYSVQEILLGLVHDKGDFANRRNRENSESLAELGQKLYQKLFGRRYLIVMDDVWSTKAWDDLKSFFPNNGNQSRIIVTTRLSNVAFDLGSYTPYSMDFLDEGKSWKLFCEKAFSQKGCPPELEAIGMNIAKGCRGLPLAIVVIGGLLANSTMTRDYWEEVAKNVNYFANSRDEDQCLMVLSLSYNNLPIYLKPCFLYMRVFPEDYEIPVSKLIKSWVAEGFVKPKRGKTLEEVAEEYLKDLIDRNLILIHQLGRSRKIKTCQVHDLIRDLSCREYQKEHFFRISRVQRTHLITDANICFLCCDRNASVKIDLPQVLVGSQTASVLSCFVCEVCGNIFPRLNRLRLVRAVDIHEICGRTVEFLQPTKVQYLDLNSDHELVLTALHLLWNLQTLVFNVYLEPHLPPEIWEMPQLRHIKIRGAFLQDPAVTQIDRKDSIILKNLQTLQTIIDFRCSEEILYKIPNLKKLDIMYLCEENNRSGYQLHNLSYLHKLESFSLWCRDFNLDEIAFPHSLKKLSLGWCAITWEKMTIIGSLPNLEVLDLIKAVKGPEWNPVEGEFLQLKLLSIWGLDLVRWNAENIHFPNLERLELEDMQDLEKIPSAIGDIATLRSIHLKFCTEFVVNSAKEIIEEQRSFGNEDLQLHVFPN